MKKKIVIAAFSTVIIFTAIFFLASAGTSYNSNLNSDDKLAGLETAIVLVIGGFAVFYEADFFYTLYYFLFRPKTAAKTVLNIISNLILLSALAFTDSMANFLYKYVSKVFSEEMILFFILIFMYAVLRIVCAALPIKRSVKAETRSL